MDTITQPPIISLANLPFIAIAIIIALFFVGMNSYLSKKSLK